MILSPVEVYYLRVGQNTMACDLSTGDYEYLSMT